MTDDFERWLRAARPATTADDGWAASSDGERMLDRIRAGSAAAPSGSQRRLQLTTPAPGRRARLLAYGLSAAAAVTAMSFIAASSGPAHAPAATGPDHVNPIHPVGVAPGGPGPRPQDMALVSYPTCAAMLADLRSHAAAHVTAYGLSSSHLLAYSDVVATDDRAVPVSTKASATDSTGSTDSSTTNDQVPGVDEPDLVKTDGDRVISVSGGELRVIDALTRKVTATLDLTEYAGAYDAQLLVDGDHALVLLGSDGANGSDYPSGLQYSGLDSPGPDQSANSTYLLVDLSGTPTVTGSLHVRAGFVDARMIDGTVRLVVRSAPHLTFPSRPRRTTNAQQKARNQATVRRAPLRDWLPSYTITTHGHTTNATVPCGQVQHPADFTGESLLSIFTVDLARALGDPHPVTLVADGDTVYATSSSLYIASQTDAYSARKVTTQLHRFDIAGTGAPVYLGSGTVPGRLLSSYSLSVYDNHLRVVTTTREHRRHSRPAASTTVYVLDDETLRVTGRVGGIGRGEQVYAVRFAGSLAFVVTFHSDDPLSVLELSDPARPHRAGELTLPGFSAYLHPTSKGRLLGVGSEVGRDNEPSGLQISLFDTSHPGRPTRIGHVIPNHTPGAGSSIDPHAFLYWPATSTAVIPVDSWNSQTGSVVVVHVGKHGLRVVGTIRNPTTGSDTDYGSYDVGIQRSLVVDGALWTVSPSGIVVSDLSTLHRQAWIPFD